MLLIGDYDEKIKTEKTSNSTLLNTLYFFVYNAESAVTTLLVLYYRSSIASFSTAVVSEQ